MKNKTAMVTGASSGIGKAYAEHYAKEGYDLIITGRRMDKLVSVAEELEVKNGISVQIIQAELSDESDMKHVLEVVRKNPDIHVLVNNAGFGAGVEFGKNNFEEHMRMLQVHVVTSLKLIYAILPQMITRKAGTIINVSSLAAYMPAPGSTMYSATKLFLKSFTESLYMEVHKYGIKIQCLCPGFTHSDFHARRSAGHLLNSHNPMWMDADKVVEKSMKALRMNRVICLPGIINKMLVSISSLVPRKVYYFLMQSSGNVKIAPRLFDGAKQFIEKAVSFFLPAHANQVRFLH